MTPDVRRRRILIFAAPVAVSLRWRLTKLALCRVSTQVVLESAATAAEYDSAQFGGGSDVIRRDMEFDRSRDHVYVMTSRRVWSSVCFARTRMRTTGTTRFSAPI